MSMPNVNAHIKAPVSDSCNCCDNVSFFCFWPKAKSPSHKNCKEKSISNIASTTLGLSPTPNSPQLAQYHADYKSQEKD